MRNVIAGVIVATLVGGFTGIIVSGFVWALHRRRRREIADLTCINTSEAMVKSSSSWLNASSPSIVSPQESLPIKHKRQISEPILLKDFEGKGVSLPPHIAEMLNVHSKLSRPELPPLSFSPDTSLRQLPYGPELDKTDNQNTSRVPMLLRQPRRKLVNNPHQGLESVYSTVSAESMYSEASAPSHVHHMFSTATSDVLPSSSLTPLISKEGDIELISMRKTKNRGSSYWTLDPSSVTIVSSSIGEFNKVRGSIYN
ncbi:hypothetical protein AX15_003651 [Amanita polypyramis BW_CC]|nr:hypothetical protein AX15_003651 [Amanita polypyramis BW_CC]